MLVSVQLKLAICIFLNQFPNFMHLLFITRKIKYIIGMIWWQFRKKKIKRRLFERIRASEAHG